jgi:hypothetical protein
VLIAAPVIVVPPLKSDQSSLLLSNASLPKMVPANLDESPEKPVQPTVQPAVLPTTAAAAPTPAAPATSAKKGLSLTVRISKLVLVPQKSLFFAFPARTNVGGAGYVPYCKQGDKTRKGSYIGIHGGLKR